MYSLRSSYNSRQYWRFFLHNLESSYTSHNLCGIMLISHHNIRLIQVYLSSILFRIIGVVVIGIGAFPLSLSFTSASTLFLSEALHSLFPPLQKKLRFHIPYPEIPALFVRDSPIPWPALRPPLPKGRKHSLPNFCITPYFSDIIRFFAGCKC